MTESVVNFGEKIGITGLDFHLTREGLHRALRASSLPFVLLCSMLTYLALDLFLQPDLLPDQHENWARIYYASQNAGTGLAFVCLAFLILCGIPRWDRAEASWMLLVGAVCLMAAFLCVLAVAAISGVQTDSRDYVHLRLLVWTRWSIELGAVAPGYLFIAYRGLAGAQPANRGEVTATETAED